MHFLIIGSLVAFGVWTVAALPTQGDTVGPIQWNKSDGGNNHYYEFIYDPNNLVNWTQANALASARTLNGVAGHLVTVTSAGEDQFIFDAFGDQFSSHNIWAWIGLTDEVVEGDYRWVTGEAFDYSNWHAGEPNNKPYSPIGEDHIHYQFKNLNEWGWNDAINSESMGYIVEYNAVPTPTALVNLVGLAFTLIAVGLWRRRRTN